MKRIEKQAAHRTEVERADNGAAVWAEAWTQQLNRSGEIYGRLFSGMRDEVASFMQKRLEANMETARAWTTCRSVNEALDLQQSWLRCAIEQYSDESVKMSELCRGAIFPADHESVTGPQAAATERKPAHEPTQSHVQRAAE